MTITIDEIEKYWTWRINNLGFTLLHFTKKSEIMTWETYEKALAVLKMNLENKMIPENGSGDLTTYYSWKNQPAINKIMKCLPSESRMKDYYGAKLREMFGQPKPTPDYEDEDYYNYLPL